MRVKKSRSKKSNDLLTLLNKRVSQFRNKYKLTDGKAFGMWFAIEYLG